MVRPSTFFRLLLYCFLTWVLLILAFVALPIPQRDDNGSNYPSRVLRSRERLTRFYEMGEYYYQPYGESFLPIIRARESGKEWFSLDFEIDETRENLIISGQQKISLTPKEPRLSEPFVVTGRAANPDDVLGLDPRWFQKADSALLAWEIQRQDAYLTLRSRWKDNALEIWPDSKTWAASETVPTPPRPPPDMEPLISIQVNQNKFTSASTPHPPLSLSPSATYPIRSAILRVLAPAYWVVYSTFSITGLTYWMFLHILQVGLFVGLIGAAVWVKMDRPSWSEVAARTKTVNDKVLDYVRPLRRWRRNSESSNRDQEEGKQFPV